HFVEAMSVREDRENRPKVHLPGLRSGLFPECKLRLSETYLFRNPDLSIPGFRLALAIASLAGMTTRLFFGNPTHRPDLRPGFAKDDLTENALNLSARGKRPLTPLARAGKGTGKNKSPGKSLSSLSCLRNHIHHRGFSFADD